MAANLRQALDAAPMTELDTGAAEGAVTDCFDGDELRVWRHTNGLYTVEILAEGRVVVCHSFTDVSQVVGDLADDRDLVDSDHWIPVTPENREALH